MQYSPNLFRWQYHPDKCIEAENTGRSWTIYVDGDKTGLVFERSTQTENYIYYFKVCTLYTEELIIFTVDDQSLIVRSTQTDKENYIIIYDQSLIVRSTQTDGQKIILSFITNP